MPTQTVPTRQPAKNRTLRPWRLLVVCLCLCLLPGCGGCKDPQTSLTAKEQEELRKKKLAEELAKKNKPKPKPDFDKLKLRPLPNDDQELTLPVKPGHWTMATLDAKANNFDFTGELDAGMITSQGDPILLEHTDYRLLTSRPASLPKGQAKRLELLFYVPRSVTTTVATRVTSRSSRAEVLQDRQPLTHLPAYQYFIVVLAGQPERYRFLKVMDTVSPPHDEVVSTRQRGEYYRVLYPKVKTSVALPSNPLAWTSTAVLVWDDIPPKSLRRDQQQALLDWLHWGGQLVISGPRTLELLAGSFLEPYLPATGGKTIALDEAALAEFNRRWTVHTINGKGLPLAVTQPWSAVELKPHAEATYLPGCDGLLAERRVGRGRVVVSAFRLFERDLINWRSFDSLLNSALLRRPSRIYQENEFDETTVDWIDHMVDGRAKIRRNARFDPALITNVRYFSRDGGTPAQHAKLQASAGLPADLAEHITMNHQEAGVFNGYSENGNQWMENANQLLYAEHQGGVASWNDFSPVPDSARESLREAAGIVVPHRGFVVWTVGLYLLVIVPLNWLVFWALGKVEWAWVAAPLIAIVCALAVVRLARLDIGFARSKTEIAVVELQGSYPRAHVARFTALYTSLSTGYDVQLDAMTALAAPFATRSNFQMLAGQSTRPVMFRRDNQVHLTGYQISSNSTGMLRTEQMLDLGGGLHWSTAGPLPKVTNSTNLPLEGVVVLRKTAEGTEYAWVGQLPSSQEATLQFRPRFTPAALNDQRQAVAITAEQPPAGAISLNSLIRLAQQTNDMQEGDVRLVGWTNDPLPEMHIQPRSSQQRQATMVIAHLVTALGPTPLPDVNTRNEPRLATPEEPEGDLTEPTTNPVPSMP